MSTDPLLRDLVEMLNLTRSAERDVFGAIDPQTRDKPIRPDDWSPKDFQAHLSAWKARQADRYAAVRRGEEPSIGSDGETDALNAKLRLRTADWPWDEIERQADEVHARLVAEVESTQPVLVRASGRLIGGTFGNGAYHAAQHFAWLRDAGVPVDADRFRRFVAELADLVQRANLPPADQGVAIYNTACYAALDGDLQRARDLLPEAFRLNPDLVQSARDDSDLAALKDEITDLAGQ